MTESLLRRSEPPWLHRTVIGLLILIGCLIMINSSSVVDTARDVYNAWQIAEGNRFPLEGPYVGGVFHGGPIWYYVLALPLFLTQGWLVTSVWVGLLTGMKYVLAYACGSRLVDRTFGLLWACLLALPDWTSVNYLIFSHTNLVETSLLFCFYSLIRWQQGSDRWFLVMCLSIGLGIHAHPTVYAAGLVAAPFIIRSLWRKDLAWWLLPVGAVAAALPLLPYIISQSLHQWPDLETGGGYFSSQPLWMNLQGFWDVMQGALLDGPIIALRHVLGLEGVLLVVSSIVLGSILVGGVALSVWAVVRRSGDWMPILLLPTTLLCIAAVALIRNVTPFYQTFVIYPPFYALVAWGWWNALKPRGFPILRTMVPVSLVFLSGFGLATLQMGRGGLFYVPQASLMNVRVHSLGKLTDTIYYPGWGRQQLGSFICEQEQPIFFHGFASLVLEQSYALEARMRCDTGTVYMGGQGEGRHYLGISNRDSGQMGIQSATALGSMNLCEVGRVIAPSEVLSIPEGSVYPPRPYYFSEKSDLTLNFTGMAGEMLAITNLYYYWMPYTIEVTLNGRPVEPQLRSMVNAFYGCSACVPGEIQNWSVTITAPKPNLVEVVTFTPARQCVASGARVG